MEFLTANCIEIGPNHIEQPLEVFIPPWLEAFDPGAVLGKQVSAWREVDLKSARGVVSHNGRAVGEGVGGDVMGHPIEPLVWLANQLAQRGYELTKGQVILTGSLTAPVSLAAGDTVGATTG